MKSVACEHFPQSGLGELNTFQPNDINHLQTIADTLPANLKETGERE